jgi:hypothetical protein
MEHEMGRKKPHPPLGVIISKTNCTENHDSVKNRGAWGTQVEDKRAWGRSVEGADVRCGTVDAREARDN